MSEPMSEPMSDERLAGIEARLADAAAQGWLGEESAFASDRRALLAEARRFRAELSDAVLLAHGHDQLQESGRDAVCRRCRLEGRREGLLEAAEMLEGRPFGPHTSPHIDAPLLKAAARLRALAGQVDGGSGAG